MNIKLLFIPLLLFSSQLYAETIHLGILNTSGNEAENVLYAETASVREFPAVSYSRRQEAR